MMYDVHVIMLRCIKKGEPTRYLSRMRFIVLVKIVINTIDQLDRMKIVRN